MNLFSVSDKRSTITENISDIKEGELRIIIISPRNKLTNDLTSILSMNNITNYLVEPKNFFSLEANEIKSNINIVIIDIADNIDINMITEKIGFVVPKLAKCILVGEVDSISFSQELTRKGASYLHTLTQLWQLPKTIREVVSNSNQIEQRETVKISVLSCKGGIGNSFISYKFIESLGQLTAIPTLLIQGAKGSQDLDLIMEVPFSQKNNQIHEISKTLNISIEPKNTPLKYNDPQYNLYNIVLFDQGGYMLTREELAIVFQNSHTLVLVINYDLASLRVAKIILDEYKRLQLAASTTPQKVVIFLNENMKEMEKLLSLKEINEYLGKKIDIVIPYINKKNKKNKKFVISELHTFAAKLLGKQEEKKEIRSLMRGHNKKRNGQSSLLSSLLKK